MSSCHAERFIAFDMSLTILIGPTARLPRCVRCPPGGTRNPFLRTAFGGVVRHCVNALCPSLDGVQIVAFEPTSFFGEHAGVT